MYSNMTKYRAKRTQVGGHKFASQMEATRYLQLKQLEQAGVISNLELQTKFTLIPTQRLTNGEVLRPVTYVADFTYVENGKYVVEDVKGYRTEVYKLKRKLMAYEQGIIIKEINKNDL